MRLPAALAALFLVTTAAIAMSPPPLTPEGLGAVHIGMTVRQAERALGGKLKIEYPNDKSCGQGGRADGAEPDVWYLFENGHLARIDIGGADGRHLMHSTAAGIHAGSTEAEVRAAYPHVVTEPHPYNEHGHYLRVATNGTYAGFIFETDGKRVGDFRAGIYPALGYQEGCV
jgi:hypothetical protein